MSVGNSNVMLSSSSSSSSSSSATKIGELITKFDETKIKSFVIGISKLKFHWLDKNIAHTALFLSNEKRGKLENKSEGILVEYGYYPPDEPNAKKKEEDFVINGQVIYRYGEKGGLRYYTNTFEEFKDKFCDIGYIPLKLDKDKEITFNFLIEKIAPISEKKWIKEKYNAVGYLLFGKALNCQTFTCHSIDVIKATYEKTIIRKGKESSYVSDDNLESIIPDDVKKTLKKYEED
jgi:hypothetical protein